MSQTKLKKRQRELRESLGSLISELRKAHGWSTSELAERLYHAGAKSAWNDYRYVWALEKGERAIDLEDLEVLADALQTDMQAFLLVLLPSGLAIDPDEARAQVLVDFQASLQRAAKRTQEELAKTLSDDVDLRATIAELAQLTARRRMQVRDHVRGLRKLEGEESLSRTPTVSPDMREVKRPAPIRPAKTRTTKTSRGGSKKR